MAVTQTGLARLIHSASLAPVTVPSRKQNNSGAKEHDNVTVAAPQAPTSELPTSIDADSQALKLWTDFEKSMWGMPLQDWLKLHPELSCEPFHGRSWGVGADSSWSHRCSNNAEAQAAPQWLFYVFDLQDVVPRLEQFDATTNVLPEETLASVENSLRARMTSRYGAAEDRSPKMGRAVSWPQYLRWTAPDLEIQLNLGEFDKEHSQGRLRLQVRHRALLEALNEDERLRAVGAADFLYGVGSPLAKPLAENLRSDFPDVAMMLLKSQPDPDPQQVRAAVERIQNELKAQAAQQPGIGMAARQNGVRAAVIAVPQRSWTAEELHDALIRLLTDAKTSPPERRPILLLAADQLAGRLPSVIANDKGRDWDWSRWRSELATFGITYSPGMEQPWSYGSDLLKRVGSDYSDTEWGERAFILLLTTDATEGCAAGSDQFRQVIQQGLPFLEKNASGPNQLDVQLAVAQAYETWWSLSQAPTEGQIAANKEAEEAEGPDADPREYQQGAEAARQQAIARYTRLLEQNPQSDYAIYARRQLPRLKLGIDTGQRRFYCMVMD